MTSSPTEKIERICRYIDEHVEQHLTLAQLAAVVDWSPAHLQKTFKTIIGVSPKAYHEAQRLARFKAALHQSDNVTDAIFEAGYGSMSRAYEKTHQTMGMTPGEYKRGGQDLAITCVTYDTALGLMLLAATDTGLCAVSFGESTQTLMANLQEEFPKAKIQVSSVHPLLQEWFDALDAHLEGHPLPDDLPLDLRGTAFQIQVWRYLRTIAPGETQTYKEIAQALDKPTAYRAVARACATNKLALVIPCHRVIRSNGQLAGYKWGIERKATLLAKENHQLL